MSLKIRGLFSEDTNTGVLDKVPCRRCGKVPEIWEEEKKTKNGYKMVMNRSSRMDCDASVGKESSRLQTYHKECWLKEVE